MDERNYKLYVHINRINGKKYIGITCQKVEYRWNNGKGYKTNEYFTNAIKKYGWDNFIHEVLFDNLTKEEAKLLEQMYILLYDTTNREYGYNISLGGESGNHSEETKKKLSEINKGKIVSEETRKKMSENNAKYWKGKPRSQETKKKLSDAKKGKPSNRKGVTLSEESRKKQSESHKGKKRSEESRKKQSESRKGKPRSQETRDKIGEGHKKAVYIIELDKEFESVTKCAEFLGCKINSVSNVLDKSNKTIKGYHIIRLDKLA